MIEKQRPIRVLIVDDSAVVRQTLLSILSNNGNFIPSVAPDAYIAMAKMAKERPDVILLDLEMPGMDGMKFLTKIMAEDPIPVVICSGYATNGSQTAMRALEIGAVEVVAKPKIGVREFLTDSAVMLMDSLAAAAQAKLKINRIIPSAKLSADLILPKRRTNFIQGYDRIIAIGASTGGTEALRVVLEAMPANAPAMVIVQHMPEGFTAAFATRLNNCCRIEVKEACDGDKVFAGRALIAAGNRHMILARAGTQYLVHLQDGPLISRHRPSVDVLFRSAAQTAGRSAIGVIMTGMGDDGAEGLLELKQVGADTIAQDEESCVVFGMPHEAIIRGAVKEVLPLGQIADGILKRVANTTRLFN
ncbi:MAG: chemotaxis response regulator protein-glutamate methylesterase [Deltaproteobacteria bacterium]|nr:chemotaxis response regulator protein-glutamate methylesterase [Deltaproteobacteria bacterium]